MSVLRAGNTTLEDGKVRICVPIAYETEKDSGRGTRLHFLCRTVYPSSALRRALPRSGRVSRLRQFSGAVPVSVCGRGGAGRKMLF